jgi:hypothetical protein
VEILDICREKGMTKRQALLFSTCRDYSNIYEKCLSDLDSSEILEASYALFHLLLLLTGDRPGNGIGKNGLSSLNHEDITISECFGIFRLQFTGSLKSTKFSLKTIIVDKQIATFIQKIKRSDSVKLFGKLKVKNLSDNRMFNGIRKLFPTFEFGMA